MSRRMMGTLLLCAVIAGCTRGGSNQGPSPSQGGATGDDADIDVVADADQDGESPAFQGLEGFLPPSECDAILARTERVTLQASRDTLTQGERVAVEELVAVGEVFHRLYEDSLHSEAYRVRDYLSSYQPRNAEERAHLEALRDLYRLFRGPIVTTLDNERVPLAPVAPYAPERNIYPPDTDAEALRAYAVAHPREGLLDVRTKVRHRNEAAMAADHRRLERFPVLDELHPDLKHRLQGPTDPDGYYAVPYAVAYADEMVDASRRLRRAADAVRPDDEDLADYLEQRGRDLLSNDYEGGDAVWVAGRTKHLNAEIGAYETYDDHLLGLRAFFALSILIRDPESSRELESAVAHLPELERELPGGPYGSVRADIPIGVYDVLADYGQARGANTASILPNEERIVRRYGRTILIRRNVLTNPAVVSIAQRRFRAAVAASHADDLGGSGGFDRTVFHEVGHYLGPRRTVEGRSITEALGNMHNTFEELKADLVSLWLMPRLVTLGVIDSTRMRSAYASGVLRVLVSVEPRRDQAYRTMQLMQQNYFLDRGLLRFEREGERGVLHIDYARYPRVIEQMLSEVVGIQHRGSRAEAEAFIERWARWDPAVQGAIGDAVSAAAPRYVLVDYPQQ